ncbi:precorrin-6y C5,15-methyltransferase (decarboxylating) subunit CbiE [Desulfuromonas sp. AOP6]|uniref:precorrin-6y C5,15-methyltransferase (decarboxylating) subunit CbiE n=1 Tax=Desulfuromonas sp. AOP6 TaxID=1566351 RepID=UPI001271259E|nr:precorrin-6y C5,15-methyltransferase (decarboxylating) subunit CbiE [Desulfuromonas sp. AOP6]BCA79022.1 cobalt-precorrin-7 (C (5))-methyltransferase [Desulfuromonas sp. AOP6]
MNEAGKIIVAGCGPGHPDYITEAVRIAVSSAELLVGTQHLLELFPDSLAERLAVGKDMEALLNHIEEASPRAIVVLTSGDTGLYSLARTLLKRFGFQRCRLIPGISAVQVACARLALDWHDLKIISAHGREPECSVGDLSGFKKIAILAGTENAKRWSAAMLEALGDAYTAIACENLTWEEEKITELDASGLLAAELASRTIILLIAKEGIS